MATASRPILGEVSVNLRPFSTRRTAVNTVSGANPTQDVSRSSGVDVSEPLHTLSLATDYREANTPIVSLLERAGDVRKLHCRDARRLLAIGYLWQGDVDGAVSLVCDMLCHPAPAGFRSLLHLLLQFGQQKASAVKVSPEGHCADSPHQSPMPGLLSDKETAVLRLIGKGHSNKSIARELNITPETVKCHAKKIFFKLSSHTRAEAVARALAIGIL